jgi:IS30 family transposase
MPINSDAPYAPFERITAHATNGIIRTGNLNSFFSKEIRRNRKRANHTNQVVASGEESESKWKGSPSETIP